MSCFKSHKAGKKQHLNATRIKQIAYKNKHVGPAKEALFFFTNLIQQIWSLLRIN